MQNYRFMNELKNPQTAPLFFQQIFLQQTLSKSLIFLVNGNMKTEVQEKKKKKELLRDMIRREIEVKLEMLL